MRACGLLYTFRFIFSIKNLSSGKDWGSNGNERPKNTVPCCHDYGFEDTNEFGGNIQKTVLEIYLLKFASASMR